MKKLKKCRTEEFACVLIISELPYVCINYINNPKTELP